MEQEEAILAEAQAFDEQLKIKQRSVRKRVVREALPTCRASDLYATGVRGIRLVMR